VIIDDQVLFGPETKNIYETEGNWVGILKLLSKDSILERLKIQEITINFIEVCLVEGLQKQVEEDISKIVKKKLRSINFQIKQCKRVKIPDESSFLQFLQKIIKNYEEKKNTIFWIDHLYHWFNENLRRSPKAEYALFNEVDFWNKIGGSNIRVVSKGVETAPVNLRGINRKTSSIKIELDEILRQQAYENLPLQEKIVTFAKLCLPLKKGTILSQYNFSRSECKEKIREGFPTLIRHCLFGTNNEQDFNIVIKLFNGERSLDLQVLFPELFEFNRLLAKKNLLWCQEDKPECLIKDHIESKRESACLLHRISLTLSELNIFLNGWKEYKNDNNLNVDFSYQGQTNRDILFSLSFRCIYNFIDSFYSNSIKKNPVLKNEGNLRCKLIFRIKNPIKIQNPGENYGGILEKFDIEICFKDNGKGIPFSLVEKNEPLFLRQGSRRSTYRKLKELTDEEIIEKAEVYASCYDKNLSIKKYIRIDSENNKYKEIKSSEFKTYAEDDSGFCIALHFKGWVI
jgi:hypothetical protein